MQCDQKWSFTLRFNVFSLQFSFTKLYNFTLIFLVFKMFSILTVCNSASSDFRALHKCLLLSLLFRTKYRYIANYALQKYRPARKKVLACHEEIHIASAAQRVSWFAWLHLYRRLVPHRHDSEQPSQNSHSPCDLSPHLECTKHLKVACLSTCTINAEPQTEPSSLVQVDFVQCNQTLFMYSKQLHDIEHKTNKTRLI